MSLFVRESFSATEIESGERSTFLGMSPEQAAWHKEQGRHWAWATSYQVVLRLEERFIGIVYERVYADCPSREATEAALRLFSMRAP